MPYIFMSLTAFFIWMNRVCSPLPFWASVEAMKFAVATMPHKGAGLRILYTHLKNAVRLLDFWGGF
ncbi:hypothetical protein DCC62_29165 [candidate division KSB1 bacterium]|nr:MAG: hypothetical protein DCC62_29165 [candidate division KSB1 bacterium]